MLSKCHRQLTAILFINKHDGNPILPKGTFFLLSQMYQGPVPKRAFLVSVGTICFPQHSVTMGTTLSELTGSAC